MNTWRFTCIKIWVRQLLIGNTTNVVSPRKSKTVPITSAFPLQLWPPHMGNKLACESKTRNWETLATSISKHDRCILNDEVCRRKPSKIWCGAFARGTFWWIHTWLQKFSTFWKACLVTARCWRSWHTHWNGCGGRGCPADAVMYMLWIMQLTGVNWFRCRLHRSSWSLRRQTRAIASRMSSSFFKHNTTGAYPHC